MLRISPKELKKLLADNYLMARQLIIDLVRELVANARGNLINLKPGRLYYMLTGNKYPDPFIMYQVRYIIMEAFGDCWRSEFARVKVQRHYRRLLRYTLKGYVFDLPCVRRRLQELNSFN